MKEDHSLILKELNLKITPKRIAILDTIAANPCYMTPDEVWRNIKERFSRIGLPTIYRNLEELSVSGIISKVIHPDRKLYYYFCKNKEHHHHFVCLSCRRVDEINTCNIADIQRDIENTLNGKVLNHILQLNGMCSECLETQGNDDNEG